MIYEKAHAKLNLDLEVYSKRDDGFHEIKSVAIPLKLADELTFEFSDEDEIICNVKIENNIVEKARDYFNKKYRKDRPVKITINKKIPIGAGLGGGSADAAATLRGLSRLHMNKVDYPGLTRISELLGSDVKFCLYNKTAIMRGRGEKIHFMTAPNIKDILLFVPDIEISTAKVYEKYHMNLIKRPYKDLYVKRRDYNTFFKEMDNDLLAPALELYPKFKMVYDCLKKEFPLIKMSGSGSTLFLIEPGLNMFDKIQKVVTRDLRHQKVQIFYTTIYD